MLAKIQYWLFSNGGDLARPSVLDKPVSSLLLRIYRTLSRLFRPFDWAEPIPNIAQQIPIILYLVLGNILELLIHLDLHEVLVEDAVLRQLLVVRYLSVTHRQIFIQLHSEHVHLLNEWLFLRINRCLCRILILFNQFHLEVELVNLRCSLCNHDVHLLHGFISVGVCRLVLRAM